MSNKFSPTTLVLNRNFVLTTTKGHSVAFVKNVPTHVPPAIYTEALAIGAIPPEGEAPLHEEPKLSLVPTDPAERNSLILTAILELVADNTRENFTAAGSPSVDAVAKLLGFKVAAKEIAVAWQGYHEKIASDALNS